MRARAGAAAGGGPLDRPRGALILYLLVLERRRRGRLARMDRPGRHRRGRPPTRRRRLRRATRAGWAPAKLAWGSGLRGARSCSPSQTRRSARPPTTTSASTTSARQLRGALLGHPRARQPAERFGAGDGHLLVTAFLDHGPWAGAGPHLVNGLLVALLPVDIAPVSRSGPRRGSPRSRTAWRCCSTRRPRSRRLAARPAARSPNLDFAAFVLVAVGMLYLAEAVERGPSPRRLTATAAFAARVLDPPALLVGAFWLIAVAVFRARRTTRTRPLPRGACRCDGPGMDRPADDPVRVPLVPDDYVPARRSTGACRSRW